MAAMALPRRGLDKAPGYGWVLADMKHDWKTVFPSLR